MKAAAKTSLVLVLALCGLLLLAAHSQPPEPSTVPVIVQAADLDTAAALVHGVGGTITHELGIIRAVGALVTSGQRSQLEASKRVRIYENRTVSVSNRSSRKRTVASDNDAVLRGPAPRSCPSTSGWIRNRQKMTRRLLITPLTGTQRPATV